MLSNKLNIWIGLAGFTLAIAGCPGDDSSGDTNNTTDPTTGVATTDASSSGGAVATETGVATTDAESTGAPQTTTGTVTCDPACADNEECIDGVCFPTGEDDSSGDPPPTNADYGSCAAGCAAGEAGAIIPKGFCFCSPVCDGVGSACPSPSEGDATAACVLNTPRSMEATQCALTCNMGETCPTGAECVDVGGASICTYPQ